MNVLVVSNTFPFPPRNGLTIPVANYVKILDHLGVEVDLFLAEYNRTSISDSSPFRQVIQVQAKRNSKVKSFLKEVLLKSPHAANFEVDYRDRNYLREYDAIIFSPFSICNISIELTKMISELSSKKPKLIAAISDCYTAELFNLGGWLKIFGFKVPDVIKVRSRIRSIFMSRIEPRLLSKVDCIFVQSPNDREWLRILGGNNLANKVEIVTNGVDETLFSIPISLNKPATRFCFVADLRTEYYRKKLLWLYENVWLKIDRSKLELCIIGKGISKESIRFSSMLADPSVKYIDQFMPQLSDVYEGFDFAFAPIYKSYGFINKVGEAMASGLVVIGDESAFNAIRSFKNWEHGIIANSAAEFIIAVQYLVDSDNSARVANIKENARGLAIRELRWNNKMDFFESIITSAE